MSCERARELFIDTLIEPLDEERGAELREHLADCEPCSIEAAGYRDLWQRLDEAAVPKPQPNALVHFEARIQEYISDGHEQKQTGRHTLFGKLTRVALLVGLGVLLAIGFNFLRESSDPAPAPGDRYLLVLTGTLETPELSEQVEREMSTWIDSLRQRGILESVVGLAEGPPVGIPREGPIMTDDIVGFVTIRATSADEARSISVSSPSIRYGGLVEVRRVN